MSNNKRFAALVLAHKNVSQVERLVKALVFAENVDVFIHFDKKFDISEEKIKKIISVAENRVFVLEDSERVSTFLDDWSLVEATLRLADRAFSMGKYKYYMLLSGQDYILKNMQDIVRELEEGYPRIYIDCTPYDRNNWVYYKFCNWGWYGKINTKINNTFPKGHFRKILKVPLYLARKVARKRNIPYKKLTNEKIHLYGGSAWWIMPDKMIEHILKELKSDREYINILKKTYTPEEQFFQVMCMNSPYSENVCVNPVDMISQNSKTYAYFFDKDKPFKGHPYIFTMEDCEKLRELAEDKFFARKFDMDCDSEVFDWIDDNLIKKDI